MTENEVVEIIDRRIEEIGISVSKLIALKPSFKSKEVAFYLDKSIRWVQLHRHELGGKRINRKGDLRFDASKIVQYKIDKMKY